MKPQNPTPRAAWRLLMPLTAMLLVAGCGGGGGTAVPEAPPAAPAAPTAVAVSLSGVAATGAPLVDAQVQVQDASATAVCETTTDADGRYSCTLAAGAQAPLTVVARLGEQALYSTTATLQSGTVNITPLTTLIAARLSPSGDPARLAEEIKADPALVDAAKLATRVQEVQALIKPLTDAVGNAMNPISGDFSANGQGHDKVLDALLVNIRPEAGSSNIDITVKLRPDSDASAPLQLSFNSSDTSLAPLTAAIDPGRLAQTGIGTRLTAFLARATDCYAQPLAQRVANVAAGAQSATGGAAQVQTEVCRGLFVGDDPAGYLNNGAVVSSSGDFGGLFRESATGVRFDQANFEYQLANGDVMVSYRSTVTTGARNQHTLMLRDQGGQLKAVGNQYKYAANVRAYATDREFPLQPQFNWLGSGYNVSIVNRIDPATGLALFAQAIVTAPDGRQTLYQPNGGLSTMKAVVPGVSREAQVQYLAGAWQDPATPGRPSDKEAVYFANPQLSDAEVRAIPDQGVWTIEFVHADASLPNVVQQVRTLSRALTLGEVRMTRFAQLTDGMRTQLRNDSGIAAAGGHVFGAPSASAPNVADLRTDADGDAWTVPDGARSPSSVTVFGRSAAAISFNDSVSVSGAARTALIGCSPLSVIDTHCDSSTGVLQYAAGSRINYFGLWALGARQVEYQKMVNLYKIAP